MLSLWSLCSRSLMYSSSVEESARLNEDHMKDFNSTVVRLPIFVLDSKIVAETDVVVSMFQVYGALQWSLEGRGPWDSHSVARNGIQEVRDQTCERGESMTSWINRSDEALMDMRKKLATAPGTNSSESTMIPPQIQGWLLLHRARLRDQDIVGVMTMTEAV